MANYSIRKAALAEIETAYSIIEEYYEASHVVARDSKTEFRTAYFGEHSGIWLAHLPDNGKEKIVGCIALREWHHAERSGEVKRLYVQPAYRGLGIAQALLNALES